MKKIIGFFLSFSVLTSFVTQTFGDTGVGSRITFADLTSVVACFLFIATGTPLKFNHNHQSALLLLLFMCCGIFASEMPESTLTELLIILFLIVSSIVLYTFFRTVAGFESLLMIVTVTSILASVFGFYGIASEMFGLPRLFRDRTEGEVLSGFRNAGQAGAFALVMLTILIPFRQSLLSGLLSKRNKQVLNISIVVTVIFLILTAKIAAYIGLVLGLFFSVLRHRKIGYAILLITSSVCVILLWDNFESLLPSVSRRVNAKIEARVNRNISGEDDITEGFLAKNLSAATQAFEDNPLTGSGIGGFYNVYQRYEVHSTYFKMLGECGILGVIGYLIFAVHLLSNFKKVRSRSSNPYENFLWQLLPFLVGCFISWAYTYHLRKREFWILFTIICVASYLKRMDKENRSTEQHHPFIEDELYV